MTITWKQISIALFAALSLHSGIAYWLTLPTLEPLQEEPPKPTLRVSLLATIAETSTEVESVEPPPKKITPPKPPKPKLEPVPKPIIKEPVVLTPVIQKPKPAPVIEPILQSEPEPLPIETPTEIVEEPPPIQEPTPIEPSPPPISATAMAKYEHLLVAWLEKQKKYPKRAKRMRIEGEGRLRILINRAGETQKITLEQRTGNRLLDKAALDMAERANPFPPMAENDPRQTFEFIVPVVFALR